MKKDVSASSGDFYETIMFTLMAKPRNLTRNLTRNLIPSFMLNIQF